MSKKIELLRSALVSMASTLNWVDIAKYYEDVDWHWCNDPDTPSAKELFKTTLSLINALVDSKSSAVATGGITVLKTRGTLMITITERGGSGVIKFGIMHDELSQLLAVTEYFEYMEKKDIEKYGE